MVLALTAGVPAAAQSARNVLVVVNESSAESVEIGEYYARARGLPAEQILRIKVDVGDEIPPVQYTSRIDLPIRSWLTRHAAMDRILYIVLTRGVPLRIAGTGGRAGTLASVDSELALLYARMTGRAIAPQGRVANPYFLGEALPQAGRPFSHAEHDIFLVTRLDGFSVGDVKALVDRGVAPQGGGRIVLDMKAAIEEPANQWLRATSERLAAMGLKDRVILEETSRVVTGESDVVGYYSWGSNDPAIKQRRLGLAFAPGAIAGMFVSTDARTFTPPPETWTIGTWDRRESYYAGSPQSLAGDLIREGVTGLSAYVAEPFMDGTARPDILIPAYMAGFPLAEAFYLAIPDLSWRGIVIGDPLCAVVPRAVTLSAEALDPPLDPQTEMPVHFTKRWLDVGQRSAETGGLLNREGLVFALRAQSRFGKDDTAGAREALERSIAIEPRLDGSHLLLASLYEQAGESDRAAERYRSVLANNKDHIVALNNLAYLMATRQGKAADALPLAQRAHVLSKGDPLVTDTLAWVHHLAGNQREARRHVMEGLRRAPNSQVLLLHAAAIFLDAGEVDIARKVLQRAVEINPSLAETADVIELRNKLEGGSQKPEVKR